MKLSRHVGDTVISVAISEDDSLIAVGSTNKKCIVYSTATGAVLATFLAKAGVNAVSFSGVREATRLAGTFGGHIQMWHVGTQTQEAELRFGGGDAVFAMAVGDCGRVLAVGGKSSHVVIYSILPRGEAGEGGEVISEIISEIGRICPTGSSPDAGSNTVKLLIDFKWRGFARRAFYRSLALYFVHVVIVIGFNLEMSFKLQQGWSLRDVLGRATYAAGEPSAPRGYHGRPATLLLFGLAWSSCQVLASLHRVSLDQGGRPVCLHGRLLEGIRPTAHRGAGRRQSSLLPARPRASLDD